MTPTPPEPAERPSSGRRGHLAALAIIGGVFGLMACLRSPLYNTPTYDDWTYLLPTLRLASTGVLRYVRYNNACVLSQVFLGAAWLRLVGIQVGHLRVLTLLLSYATIVSAYGILRELGLRWRQSLAGALVLLACPHYVFNSYSWMSDVPALAFLHLSLWAYLAGLRRHSGYLWAGAACAMVAILTRQTSMGVPVAVLMYLAWRRHRSPAAWLAALLPVVVGVPALVLVRRIPDFHQGGIPSLSLVKQYAAAPNALALGLAYFSFVLLPLGAAYAGPIVRAVRREPGRWLVAWVCWLAIVAALAAPAPRLGSSPVWRYNADPWLLRPSTFMWRGYIHGFLIGFGSPLVPLWVQHVV
ncbi:glycosyltransferase family 39 protein, partial [bacterium]|nr:glycosyltransferase family 39 protein [bacterium]